MYIIISREEVVIYKTVKEIRLKNGLSQTQLAEKIGIPFRTYQYRSAKNLWTIKDYINVAKLNNNKIKVIVDEKEYGIDINELTDSGDKLVNK